MLSLGCNFEATIGPAELCINRNACNCYTGSFVIRELLPRALVYDREGNNVECTFGDNLKSVCTVWCRLAHCSKDIPLRTGLDNTHYVPKLGLACAFNIAHLSKAEAAPQSTSVDLPRRIDGIHQHLTDFSWFWDGGWRERTF